MSRFSAKKKKNSFLKNTLFWSVLFFLLFIILFWNGFTSVEDATLDRQQESLETALQRDIVHCYAVEGTYPPSLSYIEDHYGLTYDKDAFFVDYTAIGANIFPDITVIRLKN